MVGELDVEDMRVIAERLARELPNARLVTVPGTAHLPAMERPEEASAAIARFLDGVHAG
jgi:3-oxoadipate enol-lactonase